MTSQAVQRIVSATEVSEGAGVTVHRTIGTPALRNLDPFLMLDQFGSDDPDDYIAGFPDHPHRGFITLTYMLNGHMLHQDSMGNRGDLRSGGAQWMKAASGVIHSEMPQQSEGLMRGFQLWINLPAREKMSAPAYQEFSPQAIPVVEKTEALVKILSGEFNGVRGPIKDDITRLIYLDVTVMYGKTFTYNVDPALQGFVYLFEGTAKMGEQHLPTHSFAVLNQGAQLTIQAVDTDARFILVAGLPIKESVVQYGPFVMNTQQEIQQAMQDYRDGTLVRQKAAMTTA